MAQIRKTRLIALPGSNQPFEQEYFVEVPDSELIKELEKAFDEAPGTGNFHCAVCYHKFETHDEKGAHMETAHGYETLRVTYAESTGAETGEGSGVQGAQGGPEGRVHLRDDAQDGLDAKPPTSGGEDAPKEVRYEYFDPLPVPPEGVLQHTDHPNPFPPGHPVEILVNKDELKNSNREEMIELISTRIKKTKLKK